MQHCGVIEFGGRVRPGRVTVETDAAESVNDHKSMTDCIYIALMAAAFVAAQLYARWCGKL
jgi:hypothetical protein